MKAGAKWRQQARREARGTGLEGKSRVFDRKSSPLPLATCPSPERSRLQQKRS